MPSRLQLLLRALAGGLLLPGGNLWTAPASSIIPLTAAPPPIQITADLSECRRGLLHAEIDLPVAGPGPATFTTPLWVPGAHAPNGPLAGVTGVVFTDNAGQTLPWRRDDVNLAEFHVTVPEGVVSLHVHLDAIASSRATRQMAMLQWESLLLYPAGVPVSEIAVQPAVTIPAGWAVGTALTSVGQVPTPPVTGMVTAAHAPPDTAVTTRFAVTTVEALADSPVLAGHYLRRYALAPEITPRHFLEVAGDNPEGAALRPGLLRELDQLVREARAVFGAHPYPEYHFLLTRSDYAGGNGGVEHAGSTDVGAPPYDCACAGSATRPIRAANRNERIFTTRLPI